MSELSDQLFCADCIFSWLPNLLNPFFESDLLVLLFVLLIPLWLVLFVDFVRFIKRKLKRLEPSEVSNILAELFTASGTNWNHKLVWDTDKGEGSFRYRDRTVCIKSTEVILNLEKSLPVRLEEFKKILKEVDLDIEWCRAEGIE